MKLLINESENWIFSLCEEFLFKFYAERLNNFQLNAPTFPKIPSFFLEIIPKGVDSIVLRLVSTANKSIWNHILFDFILLLNIPERTLSSAFFYWVYRYFLSKISMHIVIERIAMVFLVSLLNFSKPQELNSIALFTQLTSPIKQLFLLTAISAS